MGQNYARQPGARSRRLDRLLAPLPAGRLLLQDVLGPKGELEILGALHPRQGRARPSRRQGAARVLRQGLPFADVAVVGGGPAGLARPRPRPPPAPRSMLIEDEPRARRLVALGPRSRGERRLRRAELLARRRPRTPHLSVLTGATCTGLFADNWLRGHPRPAPEQAARQRGRARDRLRRAADGVPQQRPARRHAGLGGPAPDAALGCGAGPAARGRDRQSRRLCRGARPARRRHRRPGGARPASAPPACAARRRIAGPRRARARRLDAWSRRCPAAPALGSKAAVVDRITGDGRRRRMARWSTAIWSSSRWASTAGAARLRASARASRTTSRWPTFRVGRQPEGVRLAGSVNQRQRPRRPALSGLTGAAG